MHEVRKVRPKLILSEERAAAKLRYLPHLEKNHDKRQKQIPLLDAQKWRQKGACGSKWRVESRWVAQPLKERVKVLPKFNLW